MSEKELMKMEDGAEYRRSICFWCNGRCRVLVKVKNDHMVGIGAEPEPTSNLEDAQYYMPAVKGCPRRPRATEIFYHPQRLNYPLKRVGERGEGKWQQISWDDAMDEICAKLAAFKEKYGPESVANSRGTLRTTDEYRARFMNLFGSPNIFGHSAICYGPRAAISKSVVGWFPYPFLSRFSKCIILWGKGLTHSYPRFWKTFNELKKRDDVKIICIDPRYTGSAQASTLWLQLRPGTDCALAMGMLNVIIKEKLYDEDFVNKWCYGFDELKERVNDYPVDQVETITWVPADKIVEAARMYAQTKPASIVDGEGIEQLANSEIIHARYILAAITGNFDIEGGDIMSGPHDKYINDREIEMESVLPREQREKQIGSDRFRLYSWRGHELIQKETIRVWGKPSGSWSIDGQAHTPTMYRTMISGEPYPIKALITASSNPMLKSPNVKLVYKALKSVDLHVVFDHWLTPTAEIADYVLPAGCWLERPYIFNSANNSNVIMGGERALPSKVEGEYERWTDFDFWRGLGVRLGQEEYWPWKTDEEAYDARLAPLGLNFKEFMERGGIDVTFSGFKKHEKQGFATPMGKIELKSTIFEKLGYDPLPKYIEPRESPVSTPELAKEYPLILMTGGRILPYYHSEHRQIDSFRKKRPDPVLQMNADTARKLGIEDGDWVWIETPRGTVKQKCEYVEGMHPRFVHAEHSWWFPEEPGEEPWLHGCWESNINICMDDDPDVCNAMIGAWPLRTALCKVYKVKQYK